LLIVDSQVHVWAADRPDRPWPPLAHGHKPTPHRAAPISAESLLTEMRDAGVDRAILVPPSWEGERNDVVAAACATYPDRYRYAARLNYHDPHAREFIANWRSQRGMVALQLTFQVPAFQEPLIKGELDWLWAACALAELPLTIYLPNALLPHIERAIERHPGLNIIINHFGLTGAARDDAAFADFEKLLALARHPRVALKASCLPFYSTQSYPYRGLHPYLRQAFDAFGPQRFFWGTDLSRLPCSYRQGVTLFTEELTWLKGDDLAWVMGRALCEWVDWDHRDE
jgi:predicted TIM-barrel fold metal-dependent hydrolase